MDFTSFDRGNLKSCIIIYGKKEVKFANLLAGYIEEFGEYECTNWAEELFKQNQSQISSSNKLIFIGNTKIIKEFIPNLRVKYSQFGMEYGWLGNKCCIYTKYIPDNKDEIRNFIDYCEKVNTDFKINPSLYQSTNEQRLNRIPKFVNDFIISASLHINPKTRKEINEQQYSTLIRNFFTNSLSEFMED